jgi:hypothetical protein
MTRFNYFTPRRGGFSFGNRLWIFGSFYPDLTAQNLGYPFSLLGVNIPEFFP